MLLGGIAFAVYWFKFRNQKMHPAAQHHMNNAADHSKTEMPPPGQGSASFSQSPQAHEAQGALQRMYANNKTPVAPVGAALNGGQPIANPQYQHEVAYNQALAKNTPGATPGASTGGPAPGATSPGVAAGTLGQGPQGTGTPGATRPPVGGTPGMTPSYAPPSANPGQSGAAHLM